MIICRKPRAARKVFAWVGQRVSRRRICGGPRNMRRYRASERERAPAELSIGVVAVSTLDENQACDRRRGRAERGVAARSASPGWGRPGLSAGSCPRARSPTLGRTKTRPTRALAAPRSEMARCVTLQPSATLRGGLHFCGGCRGAGAPSRSDARALVLPPWYVQAPRRGRSRAAARPRLLEQHAAGGGRRCSRGAARDRRYARHGGQRRAHRGRQRPRLGRIGRRRGRWRWRWRRRWRRWGGRWRRGWRLVRGRGLTLGG